MISIAILGASGYAGGELVRLVDGHPRLEAVHLGAHSRVGQRLAEVHPQLGGGDRRLASNEPGDVPGVDLAFLALPHGQSAGIAHDLGERGVAVVDLGADHRFADPAAYEAAYGVSHPHPDGLGRWAYGIPELFRDRIAGADRVAAPGCYPTSAVLGLAPLLAAGAIDPDGIVVSSISGVTGAGRAVREDLAFGAVAEGVRPYQALAHRHRPEMVHALAAHAGVMPGLQFVPHLAPMQRGLLSTCFARSTEPAAGLGDILRKAYDGAPFVHVLDVPPQTRWAAGSNNCLLAVAADGAGTVAVMAALDNLLKGAAGQAVQCANLMLGLPETEGLPAAGWLP